MVECIYRKDNIYLTYDINEDLYYISVDGGNKASKYVTISLGVVCKNATEIHSSEEIYKKADDNLYEAKRSGRNCVVMKREAICDFMLYRAKKNYVMRVWDMEHVRYAEPQLKIAGIETRRADKPKIVRKKMEELLTIFFDGTEDQLQTEVKQFRKEFMAMDVEQIAFPKGVSEVSKWSGKDGAVILPAGAKAAPIHCRASVVYNRMLSKFPEIHGVYAPIKNKSKIKYVYLKVPNHTLDYTIAWESELPKEFDLHQIGRAHV